MCFLTREAPTDRSVGDSRAENEPVYTWQTSAVRQGPCQPCTGTRPPNTQSGTRRQVLAMPIPKSGTEASGVGKPSQGPESQELKSKTQPRASDHNSAA